MVDHQHATDIQVLLESSKPALTFRHLSAHLKVPTRHAQSLLQAYLDKNPTLTPLWCLTYTTSTGTKKTTLSIDPNTLKQIPTSKALWALATDPLPKTAPLSTWLSADRSRDHLHQAAPTSETNSLRDGRYNPILSPTSVWRPLSSSASVTEPKPSTSTARSGSSLLASVKAKVKAREEARKANAKKPSSTLFTSNPTKPPSNGSSSLFSSKRLGASASAKIRAQDASKPNSVEKTPKSARRKSSSSAKNGRRIIGDSDDDDDDDQQNRPKEEEEELDEEEKRIVDMEREASIREKEEADRAEAEQAELQREVADLTDPVEELREEKDGDEPESPQLQDVDGPNDLSPSRTPGSGEKRKLNEAFGMRSVERKGGRRIRREVEETIEDERGYLVTRRVYKTYDEDGNEVEDVVPEPPEKKAVTPPSKRGVKPLKPSNSLGGKSAKKEKGKDVKRPTSKLGTNGSAKKSAKKKTKGKGIMSYFGKK